MKKSRMDLAEGEAGSKMFVLGHGSSVYEAPPSRLARQSARSMYSKSPVAMANQFSGIVVITFSSMAMGVGRRETARRTSQYVHS